MRYVLWIFCLCGFTYGQVEMFIDEYFVQLGEHAKSYSKLSSLQESYDKLQEIPPLLNFLQSHNFSISADELQKIRDGRPTVRGFFFPAKLYDNIDEFLFAQNLAEHEKQIAQQRDDLASLIDEKQRLDQDFARANSKISDLQERIAKIEAEIASSEDKRLAIEREIRNIDDIMRRKRYEIDSLSRKEFSLRLSLRRLQQQLGGIHTPEKLASLQRQQSIISRKLFSIQRTINQLLSDINQLARNSDQLHYKLRDLKSDYHLRRELSSAQQELLPLQKTQQQILKQLTDSTEKFAPVVEFSKKLEQFQQQKTNSQKILKDYEKWWGRAAPNVKIHFLLALFAVKNFSKDNYNIKKNLSFGIGGLVEVFFH